MVSKQKAFKCVKLLINLLLIIKLFVVSSLTPSHTNFNKTGTNYESSSGILDLDRVEGKKF